MAKDSKQGIPARIMQAIRNALTPPISDESQEAPTPAEARKMKAAVKASSGVTRKRKKNATRKPAGKGGKTRPRSKKSA
jgi:hypothetical protein